MVIYSGQSMVHGPWPLTIHQRRCCSDSEFEGCSSEDDNTLRDRVFKNFTNKACNFENRFHYAAQKHHCIPWFLPKGRYLGGKDIEFCTKEETILFKESMADFRLNSSTGWTTDGRNFDLWAPSAVCGPILKSFGLLIAHMIRFF